MAEVQNFLSTSFTIKELTGDQRLLRLTGRALPYRPFELSGTQRNSVEWYPGSPVGTLQVYGAKEEPTTITGAWKDVFISEHLLGGHPPYATLDEESALSFNLPIDSVRDLVTLVDDIRRKGQEIEVEWLDQARRGIIERFTVRWDNGHDCTWEIAFAWVSQAEDLDDVPFVDDNASDLGDLPNKVQIGVDALGVESASLVPQAGDRFADVALDLNEVSARIQDLSDQLVDVLSQAAQTLAAPNDSMKRAAGILDGLKLDAQLVLSIAEDVADGIALDSGGLLGEAQTFGEVLAQRNLVRQRARSASALSNLAAREEVKLLERITSTIIQVFQARDDQDLRDVALAYYGNSDSWRGLMRYNNLTSSELTAGQIVLVPAQPPMEGC